MLNGRPLQLDKISNADFYYYREENRLQDILQVVEEERRQRPNQRKLPSKKRSGF